ncbi:MAG TPA: precorrin-3B C(17)-methyltransferase, partial [Alphaproteobacteria bacterium]|nr:precorrin-3B C(17)-methyltransferase [Alphaproteobacteria bacterium]
GTEAGELIALVRDGLEQAGLSAQSVAGIFSIDVKADEPAVHALAEELGVAARFFTAEQLEKEKPRLANPSARVFAEVGCHGVAEGAALAAAGAEGDLILPKQKSANATCAIARAPAPIDARQCGHARGRLAIIGIGPGTDDWRTPEASALVARADCLVGYGLYLDLLGPLAEGKERHEFPLGAEEVRVRAALDLAAQGRDVALISSGDAGIYAMASLAFELLATGDAPGWARIAVRVAPGISALQAAAARAGAPLGHDFCAISLSDLLTPWDAIRKRIEAAAAADFVVAFYNPASQKRRHQLVEAMSILRAHRPEDTPVILARNLGRADERVRFTTIAACDPDEVDMLTLVMVGASSTRRISQGHSGEWVFTPRGYEGKNKR